MVISILSSTIVILPLVSLSSSCRNAFVRILRISSQKDDDDDDDDDELLLSTTGDAAVVPTACTTEDDGVEVVIGIGIAVVAIVGRFVVARQVCSSRSIGRSSLFSFSF